MKKLLTMVVVLGAMSFATQAQEKVSSFGGPRPSDQTKRNLQSPPKAFSRNSWRIDIDIGGNQGQNSRWDDRIESKVRMLEQKVSRLEDVVDYLLYVNENLSARNLTYKCSMRVCYEHSAFFCDDSDYRTTVAVGSDKARLFDELKSKGVDARTDSFQCSVI